MDADPIEAVREEEATGVTAVIFADLRATMGVPFVNLIWRHLATMPGMLEWTWALVKPLQASGDLRAAAEQLRGSVVKPDGIMQPACVYDAVGVTMADRGTIATMLRDYNSANASNLMSLLIAQSVLAGHSAQWEAPAVSASRASRVSPAMPKLLGLNELAPATLVLVQELDTFGRFASTRAVASLYRHLGHWPGFLAIVHAGLSVPHRDGRLRAEHGRIRALAQTVALERLLPLAAPAPLPEGADVQTAQRSLQEFTGEMIARMVVMGETMLAMLPA